MGRTGGRAKRREVYRPVNPDRIPAAIRDRRVALGWSQQDLADRLMVTQSTVARWESGTRIPGGPELVDLMALLEFTRHDLV